MEQQKIDIRCSKGQISTLTSPTPKLPQKIENLSMVSWLVRWLVGYFSHAHTHRLGSLRPHKMFSEHENSSQSSKPTAWLALMPKMKTIMPGCSFDCSRSSWEWRSKLNREEKPIDKKTTSATTKKELGKWFFLRPIWLLLKIRQTDLQAVAVCVHLAFLANKRISQTSNHSQ